MRKQMAVASCIYVYLILLIGGPVRFLLALDAPKEAGGEAADATTASVTNMIDEMREQISIQRKQIEKLQSALEQQQVEL